MWLVLQLNFGVTMPLTEITCFPPLIVLLRPFLCTFFHPLNWKYSVLVCQGHSILFSSLVDSMYTCISAVGWELVKR